jgi:transposase
MPRAIRIPALDEAASVDLRQRYDATDDPEDRLRYQVVWLAQAGKHAPEIGRLVLRSEDTVLRVLHRYLAGGLAAVPRRTPPGAAPTVTPAWEAELRRVIDLDPHAAGVRSANWTTGLLASYLAEHTGVAVSDETVRQHLLAHDYVCKRPTWTLRRRASEQAGYLGNA